jgi:hypothetical protein
VQRPQQDICTNPVDGRNDQGVWDPGMDFSDTVGSRGVDFDLDVAKSVVT